MGGVTARLGSRRKWGKRESNRLFPGFQRRPIMTLFVKYLKKHYNSVFCYQFWNPLWVSNDSLMTFLQTSDRGILDFDKLMHKYPNKLFTDKKNIKLKCYENFQQKYWALFWRSVLILSWDSQNVKCLKLLFDAETRNNYKTFSKVSSVSPNFILNIFPTPKWYCNLFSK